MSFAPPSRSAVLFSISVFTLFLPLAFLPFSHIFRGQRELNWTVWRGARLFLARWQTSCRASVVARFFLFVSPSSLSAAPLKKATLGPPLSQFLRPAPRPVAHRAGRGPAAPSPALNLPRSFDPNGLSPPTDRSVSECNSSSTLTCQPFLEARGKPELVRGGTAREGRRSTKCMRS